MTNEPTNNQVMQLALGRILRLAARPAQDGDVAEYERCRKIFMDAAEQERFSGNAKGIGMLRPGWNFGNTVLE